MPTILQRQLNVRSGNGSIYTGSALFVGCNWAVDNPTTTISFSNRVQLGLTLDHIESVFIDNSLGTGSVRLVIASPPQTITVGPGAVVNSHVDVSGLDNPVTIQVGFTGALGNVGGVTSLILRDFPVGSSASVVGGGTAGSSTTDTTLLQVAQADPSDNHASLRVHDLGSFNVLSALQSLLQGTLKTADTTLDGIVSGGQLPISNAGLTALLGAITSGKVATSDATLENLITGGKLPVTDAVLEALITGGKLAVADANLEALISSGKLAVTDAILEATARGTGATARLGAQLVDVNGAALGVTGNALVVNTAASATPTPLYGQFQTAGTAYVGILGSGANYLISLGGVNSTSNFVCMNIYDYNNAASGVPPANTLRFCMMLPPNFFSATVVFPQPLYFTTGICAVAQTGPTQASPTTSASGVIAVGTYHA